MNVILITGRGREGVQLSPRHISKIFLHELGHAFGAYVHDNDYKNAPGCWGFAPGERVTNKNGKENKPLGGRYIMYNGSADSNKTLMRNNVKFSFCSKSAVYKLLQRRMNRRNCFILDYNPFCGNGIVEVGEECDCGTIFDCVNQKCCGSRNSDMPCRIRDLKHCHPNAILGKTGKQGPSWNSASCHLSFKSFLMFIFLNIILNYLDEWKRERDKFLIEYNIICIFNNHFIVIRSHIILVKYNFWVMQINRYILLKNYCINKQKYQNFEIRRRALQTFFC